MTNDERADTILALLNDATERQRSIVTSAVHFAFDFDTERVNETVNAVLDDTCNPSLVAGQLAQWLHMQAENEIESARTDATTRAEVNAHDRQSTRLTRFARAIEAACVAYTWAVENDK